MVKIITDRFILTPLKQSDISEKYLGWMKDQQVIATLDPKKDQSIESLTSYLHSHNMINDFLFGIFTKNYDHIGNISFRSKPQHRTATCGVMVGEKEYWGKGVVLEVREKLIDWAFTELGIEKLEAGCHHTNIPAVFNFKKQGWDLEGVRKRHFIIDGKYIDVYMYAIFKDKWK